MLTRRGYAAFMARSLDAVAFGLKLAQEWASIPVPTVVSRTQRLPLLGRLNRPIPTVGSCLTLLRFTPTVIPCKYKKGTG